MTCVLYSMHLSVRWLWVHKRFPLCCLIRAKSEVLSKTFASSSSLVLNRCIPKSVTAATDSFFSTDWLDDLVTDIKHSWAEIIWMCLIALGLALVVMVLFRFLAAFIVYIIIIAVVIACLGGTAFLW